MFSTGTTRHARLLAGALVGVALVAFTVSVGVAPASAQLVVEKSGILDLGADMVANPGDLIDYDFAVSVLESECGSIGEIDVIDPLISPITCPSGNPIPSLADGTSETCEGSYPITQSDIDAGGVLNEVTASGLECHMQGQGFPATAMDDLFVEIPQLPDIQLVKDGVLDLGGDGVATPGDLIDYALVVTNIGNVTLTNVALSDSSLPGLSCPSGIPIPSMAPGDSETCIGSIAIDQDDIDAGFVENTAEVTANDPSDPPGTSTTTRAVVVQAMVQVMIPQQPLISLDKIGTPDFGADGFADPGDAIDYELVVENPGNVTLFNVSVSDPLLAAITCPSGNPIPTLAPAASETCTGSYTITAADITAGSVTNTAEAAGQDPRPQAVADDDTETVTLPAPVPTAGFWWLLALALALAAVGGLAVRRQRASG